MKFHVKHLALLCLVWSGPSFAFWPGKYSYLDSYIEPTKAAKPKSVGNANNTSRVHSKLFYDSKGRISLEEIYDGPSKIATSKYWYKNGLLQAIDRQEINTNNPTRIEYQYSNGCLQAVSLKRKVDSWLMEISCDDKNRIHKVLIKNLKGKDLESARFEYAGDALKSITYFFPGQKKPNKRVYYNYKQNRLTARTLIKSGLTQRQLFKYRKQGLSDIQYMDERGRITKHLKFAY